MKLKNDLHAVKNKDIRAIRFYGGLFDRGLSDEARAALVAFQCSLNFLNLMVAEDPNPDSAEAVFKLKLVVLYHVLSSLAKFKAAFGASLGLTAGSALDAVLGHPATAVLTDAGKKGLRNTLMHYRPSATVMPHLSLSEPLYGLVEAYYPGSGLHWHGQAGRRAHKPCRRIAGRLVRKRQVSRAAPASDEFRRRDANRSMSSQSWLCPGSLC